MSCTKEKPSLRFVVDTIPPCMRAEERWVNWRAEMRDGKWTKVPCDANRKPVDASSASSGRSFDEVVAAAGADGDLGIGFVLGDGWTGVDLDGIVDPMSGEITNGDVAAWIKTTRSYVERTPSKTGLHVIFKDVMKPEWSQNRRGFVELYVQGRFFTFTGDSLDADRDVLADQAAVDALCDKWLRKERPKPTSPAGAKRKRNPDASADDFSLACDLARKGTPRAEIEAKLAEKMIAEGRGDKAGRADYVPRTVDAAERAVEADPTPPGAKTADKVLAIALDRFELGCTPKREPFAVEKTGANVAIRLEGAEIKSTLASLYFEAHGSSAGAASLEDALGVLRGEARKTEPRELAIRYGRDGDRIIADLGRVDGKAVEIDAAGWRVVDRSPILFERTELVGELPIPVEGGTVEEFRELLNVSDEEFEEVVGWVVASMKPELSHPILMLGGGQGTGKTTAATMIVGVFDASDAPTRTQPRDVENFCVSVSGSWSSVFDNVSAMSPWFSDAMCMAATGGSFAKRKLYSDRDLSVVSFRRVQVVTGIDVGALRGDFAERVMLIELDKIPTNGRRSETEIMARFKELRPRLLGAFCGLLSKTMAALPSVKLDELPRMADFARVLAAVDTVRGTRSLATYLGQNERVAEDVIEGDAVGSAIVEFMRTNKEWSGNMKKLLAEIKPENPPRDFPSTAEQLAGKMRRLSPALETVQIRVTQPRKGDKTRTWKLERLAADPT
ncbi:MAG: hypothetical protein NTU45_04745, partial [Planctomycetota bacterium]|nr:hypothetical protein [Planctomycetota bacterium]